VGKRVVPPLPFLSLPRLTYGSRISRREGTVEFFDLFRWGLIVVVSITALFPLNVPLAALAYKVRLGPRPVPLEPAAFWGRAALAALALAGMSVVLVVLDLVLVAADIPAGVVHLGLLMLYIPPAVWVLFRVFALEDALEGLSLFLIYVLLPGLPLLLLYALFHLPLLPAESWLAPTV